MKRIGLLSDTHSFIHPKIIDFFKDCDEVWHAGDIGDIKAAQQFSNHKTFRAVYGNIDGYPVRNIYPEIEIFHCEDVKVLMVHIGGYPGKYEKKVMELIRAEKPNLLVTGHSHILKVIYDNKNELMHINPGAAGKFGSHKFMTVVRFEIDGKDIKKLEILELMREIDISA
jgi:putative phosphoesterase